MNRNRRVFKVTATLALALSIALTIEAGACSAQTSTNYTYDQQGRLISVSFVNGATGYIVSYTYDAAGNRTATTTTTGVSVWGSFQWGAGKW